MPYELLFLRALAITIIAEMLMGRVVKRLFPKYFGIKVQGWRFYLFIAAASFMTVPYVWFIWPFFVHDRFWSVTFSELWVAVMEALVYFFAFRLSFKKAFIFSLVLNAFSFGVGLLVK